MSFEPTDPILYFRLAPDPPAGRRNYLLWPAWAWRVVAPAVRERQLNVLQKAVLGLSKAGVVTAEAVSRKLDLELDLAAFIASELQQRGWTDSRGQLTQPGKEVLEEETLQSQQMVTGFVFQDPWNRELWPRFVERLEYAPSELGKDGFPDLLLGTTGKPRPTQAFMHLPRGAVGVSQPAAKEIVEVTRRHRQALRGSRSFAGGDDEDSGTFEPNPIDIARVALVDDRPQRVFLTTYFYLPPGDTASAGEWQVCDPFGMGSSPLLRRAMERQMEHSPQLRERVDRLLGSALEEGMGGVRAWKEQLQGKAELFVERQLTAAVRQLPYYEAVRELALAYVEVEQLGADSPAPTLRVALVTARIVLEALMAQLLAERPPMDITRRLAREQDYCSGVYVSTAKELGFETPLPRPLANVKRGQIESVVKYRDAHRLRPLIIANLLSARDDARHPLRKVARQEPRLLAELDTLAAVTSGQMHFGPRLLGVKDVQETVLRVYRVVGLLSGLDDGSRNPPLVSLRHTDGQEEQ